MPLIARLDHPGDPDWLAGDIIGSLTVLTGERFGHDTPPPGAAGGWSASRQDRNRNSVPV